MTNNLITFAVDSKLERLWQITGLTKEERTNEMNKLSKTLLNAYENFINNYDLECQKLREEIKALVTNFNHLKILYGEKEQEIPDISSLPLLKQREITIESIDKLKKKYEPRIKEFEQIQTQIISIYRNLDIPNEEKTDKKEKKKEITNKCNNNDQNNKGNNDEKSRKMKDSKIGENSVERNERSIRNKEGDVEDNEDLNNKNDENEQNKLIGNKTKKNNNKSEEENKGRNNGQSNESTRSSNNNMNEKESQNNESANDNNNNQSNESTRSNSDSMNKEENRSSESANDNNNCQSNESTRSSNNNMNEKESQNNESANDNNNCQSNESTRSSNNIMSEKESQRNENSKSREDSKINSSNDSTRNDKNSKNSETEENSSSNDNEKEADKNDSNKSNRNIESAKSNENKNNAEANSNNNDTKSEENSTADESKEQFEINDSVKEAFNLEKFLNFDADNESDLSETRLLHFKRRLKLLKNEKKRRVAILDALRKSITQFLGDLHEELPPDISNILENGLYDTNSLSLLEDYTIKLRELRENRYISISEKNQKIDFLYYILAVDSEDQIERTNRPTIENINELDKEIEFLESQKKRRLPIVIQKLKEAIKILCDNLNISQKTRPNYKDFAATNEGDNLSNLENIAIYLNIEYKRLSKIQNKFREILELVLEREDLIQIISGPSPSKSRNSPSPPKGKKKSASTKSSKSASSSPSPPKSQKVSLMSSSQKVPIISSSKSFSTKSKLSPSQKVSTSPTSNLSSSQKVNIASLQQKTTSQITKNLSSSQKVTITSPPLISKNGKFLSPSQKLNDEHQQGSQSPNEKSSQISSQRSLLLPSKRISQLSPSKEQKEPDSQKAHQIAKSSTSPSPPRLTSATQASGVKLVTKIAANDRLFNLDKKLKKLLLEYKKESGQDFVYGGVRLIDAIGENIDH
ncbi:hypothetical protein M9Y10_003551 [Tritrichomonas musculus]|uniref:Uncharacterized protein n=1 Tax=Tritrichomonas musculus TaxID=1915356 RepID=A0ABR2JPZ5_9EUKA